MSKIGEALLKFRTQNNLAQQDVAKRLGISQAHISRIEKGLIDTSPALASKIQKLTKLPIRDLQFNNLTSLEDLNWRYSYFFYPEKHCGDRVITDSSASPDRTWVLHCDSAGSDLTAAKDADLLVVAFESFLLALSGLGVGVDYCYSALNKSIRKTKDLWRDEPSANIALTHSAGNRIELINGGMPNPYLFKRDTEKVSKIECTPLPPLGASSLKVLPKPITLELSKEDVLLFFSDGFLELVKRYMREDFVALLETICRIQRGDVSGVGTKLLSTLEEKLTVPRIEDDISFLIMSPIK